MNNSFTDRRLPVQAETADVNDGQRGALAMRRLGHFTVRRGDHAVAGPGEGRPESTK